MASGDLKGVKENESGTYDEVVLQASASDILTGTDNTKVATPKNIKDAELIAIHVGITAPADTTKLWLDTN